MDGTATVDRHGEHADAVIAEARALSGRRHLNPTEARRRYQLILKLASVPGRKQSWIAEQLQCSGSNMSRLIKAARQAFATSTEGVTP